MNTENKIRLGVLTVLLSVLKVGQAAEVDPVMYQGTVNITNFGIPLSCTMTLYGSIWTDTVNESPIATDNLGFVLFSGAGIAGGSICPTVTISNFPWFGPMTPDVASTPDGSGTLSLAEPHLDLFGPCVGDVVGIVYPNKDTVGPGAGTPPSFTISTVLGTCTLNGTLNRMVP